MLTQVRCPDDHLDPRTERGLAGMSHSLSGPRRVVGADRGRVGSASPPWTGVVPQPAACSGTRSPAPTAPRLAGFRPRIPDRGLRNPGSCPVSLPGDAGGGHRRLHSGWRSGRSTRARAPAPETQPGHRTGRRAAGALPRPRSRTRESASLRGSGRQGLSAQSRAVERRICVGTDEQLYRPLRRRRRLHPRRLR